MLILTPEISQSPIFKKGQALGLTAQAPIFPADAPEGTLTMEARKRFLTGYAKEINDFIQRKQLRFPYSNIQPANLDSPPVYLGYLRGVKRESPNLQNVLFDRDEIVPPAVDEFGIDWNYAYQLLERGMYDDGYYMGFAISIIRDYPFNWNNIRLFIPINDSEYRAYQAGLKATTIASIAAEVSRHNFATAVEQNIYANMLKGPYLLGLMIWLFEQNTNTELASQIWHPETLAAFKLAFADSYSEDDAQGLITPERQLGHKLGKQARLELQK